MANEMRIKSTIARITKSELKTLRIDLIVKTMTESKLPINPGTPIWKKARDYFSIRIFTRFFYVLERIFKRIALIKKNSAQFSHTETRKNMNLPYSTFMYWTNFWQPTVHIQQNIFEKTLIEVGSSHLYPSFGTFCVQIGQLFEAQRVWKMHENVFEGKWGRFLTVTRMIDQFERKRCQKKGKDVSYQLL